MPPAHDARRHGAGNTVWLHLFVGMLAVAAYYLVPEVRGQWPLYSAIGLSAAAAIAVGVRWYRPDAAAAWLLFAAAEVVSVVGDIVLFSVHGAFPSAADVFYLAAYPLLAAGLFLLLRRQTPRGDVASFIDAAIITIGLGLVVWVFLMEAHTREVGVGLVERYVSIGYPLMDIVLLGAAVHLALVTRSRNPALYLLGASIVLLLGSDIVYGIVQLKQGYGDAIYLDWGWLASYLLMGAAALHPGMSTITRSSDTPRRELGTRRLILLGGALLLAPAVQALRETWTDSPSPVVYLASGALSVLVLARMTYLVRSLDRAVDSYQRAERVKDDFISTVSHELRTPLTSILGRSELLLDDAAGELRRDQRRMVEVIDRNGRRLHHLIEDLLSVTNPDAKPLKLAATLTDLAAVITTTAESLSSDAQSAGVEFVVTSEDLGTGVVDPAHLERALVNLLSNAVKFTPAGGRVTMCAGRDGDDLTVTVSDSGMGIPVEDQPFLFNRFFRSQTAHALAIPGAGLGLSIVKAVVDEHGGSVVLESEEGLGTTVTLRIPVGPTPLVPEPDHAVGERSTV